MIAGGAPARAAFMDHDFLCYPVQRISQGTPKAIHGNDLATREFRDDLLWDIRNNKRNVAGLYLLAEIGCGADCVRLALIDKRHGNVEWMPTTVSGWPIQMSEPVIYRSDSRLIAVFGQLNETGPGGPFYFLLDKGGFHPLRKDDLCLRK